MLRYLRTLVNTFDRYVPPAPVHIQSLYEVKVVCNDCYNSRLGDSDGKYVGRYYFTTPIDTSRYTLDRPHCSTEESRDMMNNLANMSVAYIQYRLLTGQIGLFYIHKEYRDRGLGKQILLRVISDMKTEGRTEVFAITTKNHPFWSNVFNKSFVWKDRPHSSVTGDGYWMNLHKMRKCAFYAI